MNPSRIVLRLSGLFLAVTLAGHTIFAQADITGFWRPQPRNQDGSGMIGDYAGVPISAAGRWRAESWSPDDYDLAEYACRPHAWDYSLEGPLSQMRVWSDVDPATQKVIAYHGHLNQQEQETTIWMDGRPHPPANALHTWSGFTTGEWEGDVLVTTTTHLKETYIRRSGLMRSDRSRRAFAMAAHRRLPADHVDSLRPGADGGAVHSNHDDVDRGSHAGRRPVSVRGGDGGCRAHEGKCGISFPGRACCPVLNPKLTDRFGTPYEARLGGSETMYPEYIAKMKTFPRPEGLRAGIWAAEVVEEIEAIHRGRTRSAGRALALAMLAAGERVHTQAPSGARSSVCVAAKVGRAGARAKWRFCRCAATCP